MNFHMRDFWSLLLWMFGAVKPYWVHCVFVIYENVLHSPSSRWQTCDHSPAVWVQMYFWRYNGSQRVYCKIYIYIYIFGWGCFDSDIVSPVLLCFHANNGELNRNKNRNHRLWGSCFTSAWKIWDQTRSCLVFFWSESESLNFSWSTTCSFMCETLTALGVHEIKTS